ncbi:3'-flap repair endonuclease Xpf [Candidatus Burarchaeum australiense]|nr:3'-flap repair endonuclease Xpf [Candidatus Burarchaeum australiense]
MEGENAEEGLEEKNEAEKSGEDIEDAGAGTLEGEDAGGQADLLEFINAGSAEGKVRIIMDDRERGSGIRQKLEARGAEVRQVVLNAGDFILSDRIAVERKTRTDFENSIIDGRLFEQASRLGAQFAKPILVVEGESFEGRINRNALLGAIASLMLDHNLQIFFTLDSERTAELLFAFAKREQLAEKRPLRLRGDKRASTMAQQQQLIVEGLPNVGPQFARALLEKFGTVEKVMKANEKQLMKVKRMGQGKARLIRKILTEPWKKEGEPDRPTS